MATKVCRMDTQTAQIAASVKLAIQREGSSMRKVCDATGIPLTTLGRRLSGQISFTVSELLAIADHLCVSASEFLPDAHSGRRAA